MNKIICIYGLITIQAGLGELSDSFFLLFSQKEQKRTLKKEKRKKRKKEMADQTQPTNFFCSDQFILITHAFGLLMNLHLINLKRNCLTTFLKADISDIAQHAPPNLLLLFVCFLGVGGGGGGGGRRDHVDLFSVYNMCV